MHKTTLTVLGYYRTHGRALPWRQIDSSGIVDPYHVVVSELMLQQTQVPRVITKFQEFTGRFPDWQSLASAPLSDVLLVWQGLGYNHRAKYLHDIAKSVVTVHDSKLPTTVSELTSLSGIGPNTAGAILTYTYNQKHIFIETNIRTVIIHHFFSDEAKVSDQQITEKLTAMLAGVQDYREFYWALMDYGTHLKKTQGNNIRRSAVYKKQSAFLGSDRQLRSDVLRHILTSPTDYTQLKSVFIDPRLDRILDSLVRDKLITKTDNRFTIANNDK